MSPPRFLWAIQPSYRRRHNRGAQNNQNILRLHNFIGPGGDHYLLVAFDGYHGQAVLLPDVGLLQAFIGKLRGRDHFHHHHIIAEFHEIDKINGR